VSTQSAVVRNFRRELRLDIAEGVRVIDAGNVLPSLTTPNMTSLVNGALPRTTGAACNTQ
jgi:hypothetical protein